MSRAHVESNSSRSCPDVECGPFPCVAADALAASVCDVEHLLHPPPTPPSTALYYLCVGVFRGVVTSPAVMPPFMREGDRRL